MKPINEMTLTEVVETIRIAHQIDSLLDEPIPLGEILRQLSERVHDLTRWIPVSERMPDIGQWVYVWLSDDSADIAHESYIGQDSDITHWRRIDTP